VTVRVRWNPSAIDRTATNTITTPVMPTIATTDDAARCGRLRRLTRLIAPICSSHWKHGHALLSASTMRNRHRLHGWQQPGQHASATIMTMPRARSRDGR